MISLSGFPVPARTLGLLLASLLGGINLSAATTGTSVGTILSGSYSLNQNISSGYIVYDGTSGGSSASGALSVGGLDSTGGGAVPYSYSLPIDLGSGPIAFVGLDAAGGVTLTANNSIAPTYTANPWPYAQAESQIETDLTNGDTSDLVAFLRAHSGDFFYAPNTTEATFLAFSNGQPIGAMSLTVTAVAEPPSALCLFVGLLFLGLLSVTAGVRESCLTEI